MTRLSEEQPATTLCMFLSSESVARHVRRFSNQMTRFCLSSSISFSLYPRRLLNTSLASCPRKSGFLIYGMVSENFMGIST
jgi:hypothetical protein